MPTSTPPTPPTLDHLLSVDFETTRAVSEGHPEGTRFLLRIQGGSFAGSHSGHTLRGTVVHGADWVVRRADGCLELDVRAELLTDDGVTVLMSYTGVSVNGRVRTTPRFSAPVTSSMAWLNPLICIAEGTVRQDGVTYEVWCVS